MTGQKEIKEGGVTWKCEMGGFRGRGKMRAKSSKNLDYICLFTRDGMWKKKEGR